MLVLTVFPSHHYFKKSWPMSIVYSRPSDPLDYGEITMIMIIICSKRWGSGQMIGHSTLGWCTPWSSTCISMAYILGSDSRAGRDASVFHGVKVDWFFTTNHQYISFLEPVLLNLETWAYPVKLSPKKRLLYKASGPKALNWKLLIPSWHLGYAESSRQSRCYSIDGVTDSDDLDSLGLWLK